MHTQTKYTFLKIKNRMTKQITSLLLFILLISSVFAQESDTSALSRISYEKPKEYEIADITISGIKYLNSGVLVQLSGLRVGDSILVPGEEITRAVEKLWKQGMFSDVVISATKIIGNRIYLDIFMLERPRLSGITFSGIKKGDYTTLEEKISLPLGSQVTDNVLNNANNTIRNYYVEKGFYNTQVSAKQRDDTTLLNCVYVDFKIEKKKKVKIQEIKIEGNKEFSTKKVKRSLKDTKQKRWYGLFKPSKYIETKYLDDKNKVIAKYTSKGYRDARILSDTVFKVDDELISINLKIEEGDKYYFRNVSWVGNTKYTSKQLSTVLGIRKGDIFDQEVLDKRMTTDQDAVSNLYLDDGYLFYNATPVEIGVQNDSIDLEIRIYEGKQAAINRVIITGNTKTNEHVIRREITTLPGDLFSKTSIIRSVRELAQLGHFDPEKLVPTPMPNQADGTVDIEYAVEEKANDQVEISGGWGQNMLVGTVGLRFNNFSARNLFNRQAWRPIPVGDGQSLAIRAQTNGKYYQSYSISFTEPWLGGKKHNSLSTSVYYTIQSNGYLPGDSRRKTMKTTAVSVGLGKNLQWPDDYFTLYNEVSYENYNLNQWDYFIIQNGFSNNFSFTSSFSRNSTDNPIYTRTGSMFSLTLKLTPPYSLINGKDYKQRSGETTDEWNKRKYTWIEYNKWTFKSAWYTKIVGNLVLMTKAEMALLAYYNSDIGHSPFEGYNLGGDGLSGYSLYGRETIGLRGYENGSLTPSAGGNLYARYTMELRYPVSLNPTSTVYALAFAEGGNAWTKFSQFNPFDVNRSAGVGVRIYLAMLGLVGIDWGYGFDPIPGKTSDNWGPHFHFVLGYQY